MYQGSYRQSGFGVVKLVHQLFRGSAIVDESRSLATELHQPTGQPSLPVRRLSSRTRRTVSSFLMFRLAIIYLSIFTVYHSNNRAHPQDLPFCPKLGR